MKTFKDKILRTYSVDGNPLVEFVTFDMFEEFSTILDKEEDTDYDDLIHTLQVGHDLLDWDDVLNDVFGEVDFKELKLMISDLTYRSDYFFMVDGKLHNFTIGNLITVIDALLALQEPYGRIKVEFGLDVDEVKSACVSFLRSQGLDATQCIVDIFDLEFQLEEYVDIDEFMEYLRSKH